MSLLEINKLQIQLIQESSLVASEWIASYSAHFRNLIKRRVINVEEIKLELYSH